jgi:dolichol-phosphate mannosyltransferase
MTSGDSTTASASSPRLLITLCTYNERENIERLIPELHDVAPDADILVIDDNSPDGTGALADTLADADPRVDVLHRAGKQGLGTAILAGFREGISRGYQHLINLDADFSHHPRHIPAMRALMETTDVAIGSRYVEGGGVIGWNWRRHVMSRGINLYARMMLGLPSRDNSGSFRCYTVSQLAELDLDRFRARGYAFQEEILYRLRRLGSRFQETPIVFEDRRFGESKISWRESVAAVWILFRLAIDRVFRVRVRRDAGLADSPAE